MNGNKAQETSEKLWLIIAAQDLSLSPPSASKSIVIELSALRFGVGRCYEDFSHR